MIRAAHKGLYRVFGAVVVVMGAGVWAAAFVLLAAARDPWWGWLAVAAVCVLEGGISATFAQRSRDRREARRAAAAAAALEGG